MHAGNLEAEFFSDTPATHCTVQLPGSAEVPSGAPCAESMPAPLADAGDGFVNLTDAWFIETLEVLFRPLPCAAMLPASVFATMWSAVSRTTHITSWVPRALR